jgi:1-acyl-sn-glycerol-3-phosphate acyltransferase
MSKNNREAMSKNNKFDVGINESAVKVATNIMFTDQPSVKYSLSFVHTIRAVFSAFCLVIWILLMLPVFYTFKYLFASHLDIFYKVFHNFCCYLFAMKVSTEGEMSVLKPTLFLSNHISYLDVFALSSKLPGYFIAKSEVAGWPVLGALAKIQNTLFFERKGNKIRAQLSIMTHHFDEQKNLILFPEGTSTEGEHVEPFKSSLLQSVEQAVATVTIQPITIAYTHYQNKPMSRGIRDQYAWYATMPFGSHYFNALGLNKSSVKIIFHPTIELTDFDTRKECALYCWQQVSDGLSNANKTD